MPRRRWTAARRNKPPPESVRAWSDDRKHAIRLYRTLQGLLGPVIRFTFRTSRKGINQIPKRGPVILVSNHASNIDPVLVVGALHRPVFHLGKHTLFTKPFRSWFFQTLGGQIPVNREAGGNEAAVQAAVKALEKGFALGIYPEGYRSVDGRLHRGKTGLGRIALLTGVPCYPVAVDQTWNVWPKGQRFPRPFRKTRVLVGLPRVYRRDVAAAGNRDACQRVVDELMGDLAALLGQEYDAETAPKPHP